MVRMPGSRVRATLGGSLRGKESSGTLRDVVSSR